MPHSCCVIGCTNRMGDSQENGQRAKFFRFPKESERRKKGTSAIRRKDWSPGKWSRVCGVHFVSGTSVPEHGHPDWVPSLHLGYQGQQNLNDQRIGRFERLKKRLKKSTGPPAELEGTEDICGNAGTNNSCDIPVVPEQHENQHSNLDLFCEVVLMNNDLNVLRGENKVIGDKLRDLSDQCAELKSQNAQLVAENEAFVKAVYLLNTETKVISNFEKQESMVIYYTGLPNLASFQCVLEYVSGFWKPQNQISLSYKEQLLMTLMKLRLGITNQDLAYRFDIATHKVSMIFQDWLSILSQELKVLISWPDDECKRKVPKLFRHPTFEKCVAIIDCSEILIERPSAFNARSQTFSDYKSHNTVKFLVAVNPHGAITFLSQCWGGRVSDKELTLKSGFLNFLKPGDVVLADRGFNIQDLLAVRGVTLHVPAFTKGKPQLHREEVERDRRLARLRIHVERAIGRIKTFKILHSVLPISLVKTKDSTVDKILTVCAALVNLKPPLVN